MCRKSPTDRPRPACNSAICWRRANHGRNDPVGKHGTAANVVLMTASYFAQEARRDLTMLRLPWTCAAKLFPVPNLTVAGTANAPSPRSPFSDSVLFGLLHPVGSRQ